MFSKFFMILTAVAASQMLLPTLALSISDDLDLRPSRAKKIQKPNSATQHDLLGSLLKPARAKKAVPECKISTSWWRPSINLQNSKATIDELLQLVSTSPTGKNLVSEIEQIQSKGELYIQMTTPQKISEAGESYAGYFDSDKKTIYLNQDLELGLLAVAFVHEADHALNQAQYRCFEKGYWINKRIAHLYEGAETERQFAQELLKTHEVEYLKCFLSGERRAYSAQQKFIDEIQEPCFAPYMKAHEKNQDVVASPLTDIDIILAYPFLSPLLKKQEYRRQLFGIAAE